MDKNQYDEEISDEKLYQIMDAELTFNVVTNPTFVERVLEIELEKISKEKGLMLSYNLSDNGCIIIYHNGVFVCKILPSYLDSFKNNYFFWPAYSEGSICDNRQGFVRILNKMFNHPGIIAILRIIKNQEVIKPNSKIEKQDGIKLDTEIDKKQLITFFTLVFIIALSFMFCYLFGCF